MTTILLLIILWQAYLLLQAYPKTTEWYLKITKAWIKYLIIGRPTLLTWTHKDGTVYKQKTIGLIDE